MKHIEKDKVTHWVKVNSYAMLNFCRLVKLQVNACEVSV